MIFIAQIMHPKDESLHFSMAAQMYQTKFIEFCNPSITLSIIPLYIKNKINFKDNNIYYFNFGKTKSNIIFNITKLLGDTIYATKIISEYKNEKIWFYNLTKSTFLIALFSKIILRREIYIIIADYVQPISIFQKIINNIIKKCNGALVLNSNINVVKNHYVLPGLLRETEIKSPDIKLPLSKNILLSGSLGYTTGLDFALEFFSRHDEFNLFITGQAYDMSPHELESLIKKYVNYKNIYFLGRLKYEDYLNTLKLCSICLSLRDQQDSQHEYNFPSKILEYLSFNKFVVSSKSYKDIHPDLIFVSEKNEIDFYETLQLIYNLPENDILRRKQLIYEQLKGNFSSSALNSIVKNLYENKK